MRVNEALPKVKDDCPWQKGLRYGTIMVDLERHEVVDVVSDRSADATGRWLEQHPEIVSRDRCGLYAEGARQGAPQAQQVADRFHLLQNLRQTIEQQLSRAPRPTSQPSPTNTETEPVVVAAWVGHGRQPALVEHRQLVSTGRRAVYTDMLNRVKALQLVGHGVIAIVRQTRFNWRTVTTWMRLDALRIASPEMLPRGQLLPHLKCSPGSSRGSEHEDSEHGDAAGAGGGDKGEVRFCSAEREDQDPR